MTPAVVSRDRVDELIDVLCDPDRRLPVVVASAHPLLDFGDWGTTISRVMQFLPGLASLYILDPLGTQEFTRAIGRTHAVWGGALRTYMQDVDPAVDDDALRHRILSATRIAKDANRAASMLSILPRRLAAEAPLPEPLARVNRTLLTQESGSPESADLDGLRTQIERLGKDRDIALDLAEEQETRANAMFAQRERALAELAEREQRLLHAESQVRALRRRLVAVGQPAEAFPRAEPVAEPPATFAELLDWMDSDLRRVAFSGDRAKPPTLDLRPESATWVRSSWEALRALESYAQAKTASRFSGDFKAWCENQHADAYVIPAHKVARDESETVRGNARWRREREFPVPKEVDPSRRIFMGAHVRIGASSAGQINPRLYFRDDLAHAGKIYVGYIGPHLTNTRS